MSKNINFEDAFFILMMRMRMIQDTLLLKADNDLFLDKTVEDIRFIDNTLEILGRRLTENSQLIEENALCNSLAELEWEFSRLIANFLSAENAYPEFIRAKTLVLALKSHSMERRETLEDMTQKDSTADDTEMVNNTELAALLGDLQEVV